MGTVRLTETEKLRAQARLMGAESERQRLVEAFARLEETRERFSAALTSGGDFRTLLQERVRAEVAVEMAASGLVRALEQAQQAGAYGECERKDCDGMAAPGSRLCPAHQRALEEQCEDAREVA